MSTVAVEVVYRGIFQKTLARNIVRAIVFAAHKEGKIGTAFGRYGDSPERNGIPAKQFAIVSDTSEELEEKFVKEASSQGMKGLKGHRSVGGIRASIYNAFPPGGVDALVGFMDEFKRKN